MPIYEYVCPKCGFKFEQLRPLSLASDTSTCPRCQQSAERILSAFACLSRDSGGQASPIGGSSCSGCSSTGCASCGL
ncbi:MAG: zinc ribbon domain-containing protein [Chloroflexi bacterium]|nr:zinc ribbon domain-containing protein [Chloroflexota bacterium]